MLRMDGHTFPKRKRLPHDIPSWVEPGTVYFLTICTEPRGVNQLCHPSTATKLWQSVLVRIDMKQWWPRLFLLMPDHVHALVSFHPGVGMRRLLSAWKRFTAHSYGIRWQRDFFDHRLRDDESFEEKAYYIRENPVRANLIQTAEEWPHVWTADGALGESALPTRAPNLTGMDRSQNGPYL